MSDVSTNSSTDSSIDAEPEQKFEQPILAKALRNTFHFWKFLMMGLLVFGFAGLWFLKDGFYAYPQNNKALDQVEAQIASMEKDGKPLEEIAPLKTKRDKLGKRHSDMDIMLQIGIGAVFTPLGLWMLIRHLRATSGKYLLENDTLSLPRGKPIPINTITAIRNAKWMTKGLAYFDYKTPEGTPGTFTLDALAYETKPCDAIHDEIVRNFRSRNPDSKAKTAKELKKD